MASFTQLGYLGLSVRDVNGWRSLPRRSWDYNRRDPDGSSFLRVDEYHHRFIVHLSGKDDLAYIGWEVGTEGELEAMAERLKQAGVAVTPGTSEEADARRVAGLIKCIT